MKPRVILSWIPPLVWGGLIWYVSSLPLHGPVFTTAAKKHLDWVVHAIEYGIFAWLFVRAMIETMGAQSARSAFWLTAYIISMFAVADEIHQSTVPYRNCDVRDAWADMAGVVVALAIKKKRFLKQNA